MSPSQAPCSSPPRRRRAAPTGPTKKTLTVAQAAAQWEKAKRAIDAQRPLLEESAAVLKAHFQRSDTSTYRDRIALVSTPGKLILDQPKVREFLGAKLARFQKRTEPSQSLTLLK